MFADFQFSAFISRCLKQQIPQIQTLVSNRARGFSFESLVRNSWWELLKMRNFSNVVARQQTKTSKMVNKTVPSHIRSWRDDLLWGLQTFVLPDKGQQKGN